jgi:hypothetical protein
MQDTAKRSNKRRHHDDPLVTVVVQSEKFDAVPDEASVPKGLKYDSWQEGYFGPPQKHNDRFAERLNWPEYAQNIPGFLRELGNSVSKLKGKKGSETIHCDIVSVGVKKHKVQAEGQSILTLSNLLFDHFGVLNRIPEMLFWCVLSACSRTDITRLVISNPVQLVRNALLSLTSGSDFHWDESLYHHDLSLSRASIEQLLETVSDEIRESGCMDAVASSYEIELLRPHHDMMGGRFLGKSITRKNQENTEMLFARLMATPRNEFMYDVISEMARVVLETGQTYDFYLKTRKTVVILSRIEIRPCAQRLRLGRIILWVIIKLCIDNDYDKFIIDSAFQPTINLCTTMGFTLIKGTACNYKISRMEMEARAKPEQCGLPRGIISRDSQHRGMFRINWDLFPTAAEMNDQRATDRRWGHDESAAAQGGKGS